jgi:hypothetical protein
MLKYSHVLRFLSRSMVDGIPESLGSHPDLVSAVGEPDWSTVPAQRVDRNTGAVSTGIALASKRRDWSVVITQGSIDCQYQQVLEILADGRAKQSEQVLFSDFLQRSGRILAAVQSHFDALAHRLATVQEGGIRVSAAPAEEPGFRQLITMPPLQSDERPHEWDWRFVTRVQRAFGDASETTNTIRGVRRLDLNLGPFQTLPALAVTLDINTIPERRKPRFRPEDTLAFCSFAKEWHESLSVDLMTQAGLQSDGNLAN